VEFDVVGLVIAFALFQYYWTPIFVQRLVVYMQKNVRGLAACAVDERLRKDRVRQPRISNLVLMDMLCIRGPNRAPKVPADCATPGAAKGLAGHID
jgi:hypothetical protein